MTLIAVNTFNGEIPKLEKHLLPDTGANYARDIDTRSGALKSLADVSPISAITAAVQSLYTENGLTFFTWPTDVDAAKSLIVGDIYSRVYYTDGNFFYGTQAAFMAPTGGPPSSSWRQGVQPPASFALSTITNATSWPDGVSISAKFFYESGAVRAQEADIGLTQVGAEVGRLYRFTPPARDAAATAAVTISAVGYYANGEVLFESPEAVTVVSGTQIQTQSAGVITAQYVLVNNLQITNPDNPPANQYLSVQNLWDDADTSGKTPTSSVPVLMITGKKGTETLFTLYSEGSSFVRNDQPAKVSIKQVQNTSSYEASIEWGGNGLIGKSASRKTASYVCTCVNLYGEESKPSDPLLVTTDYLQSAVFSVVVPAQNGYAASTQIRIYETITGSKDTAYHLSLTANQSNGTIAAFSVANALATVGPTLETIGWNLPPAGVFGLQPTPFGSYVMAKGNELYWTEPFRPHTTPFKYVMTFPNNIKAIKQTAFGLLVVTTAQGYMVTGMSPDSMARTELPVRASIVSKRAIATHGNTAWFASEDGLVLVQGVGATLEPWQRLFTREKWRERYGASYANLVLTSHDGYLVGLLPNTDGFLLRLDEQGGEFIRLGVIGNCAFVLPQTDGLYIGRSAGIVQFAGGLGRAGKWTSKEFTLPKPKNLGVLEICGDGSIPYTITADSRTVATGTVAAIGRGTMVRLPAGFKAQRWTISLDLVDGVSVTSIRMAETPQELASV